MNDDTRSIVTRLRWLTSTNDIDEAAALIESQTETIVKLEGEQSTLRDAFVILANGWCPETYQNEVQLANERLSWLEKTLSDVTEALKLTPDATGAEMVGRIKELQKSVDWLIDARKEDRTVRDVLKMGV